MECKIAARGDDYVHPSFPPLPDEAVLVAFIESTRGKRKIEEVPGPGREDDSWIIYQCGTSPMVYFSGSYSTPSIGATRFWETLRDLQPEWARKLEALLPEQEITSSKKRDNTSQEDNQLRDEKKRKHV